MPSLDQKYKDRPPQETINIIKNFYHINNIEDIIILEKSPIENVWWTILELRINNKYLLQAYGKGTNELYSKASAYAESYERFCSGLNFFSINPFLYSDIIQIDQEYINSNYKKLSYEELIEDNNFYNFLNYRADTEKQKKQLVNILFNKNLYGIPYKNINTNEIKYLNQQMIYYINGSTGLAAGNTLEEALVQGISEIFERYVYYQLFFKKNIDKIYFIKKENISFKLQKIITDIENEKNKVFILDLSYLNNTPVVGIIIYNYYTGNFHLSLGSSPIFDIALERCLTETYQGKIEFAISSTDPQESYRMKNRNMDIFLSNIGLNRNQIIPEEILFNIKYKNKKNTIFLDSLEYKNNELLEYYKKLLNELKLNCLYTNNSLDKNFIAISIYIDNLPINFIDNSYYQLISSFEKQNILNNKQLIINIFNKIINNKEKDKDILNLIKILNPKIFLQIEDNCLQDLINPFNTKNITYLNVLSNLFYKNQLIAQDLDNNIYFLSKKYIFINNYLSNNCYTEEEIEYLFNLLNINTFNISIKKLKNNLPYWFLKLIIIPLIKEIYSNEDYKLFLNIIKFSKREKII